MWEWWQKNRMVLLGVLLVLVALLWYSVSLREKDKTNLLEKGILAVTSPIQYLVNSSVETIAETWSHYLYLVNTVSENERLVEQNRQLNEAVTRLDEIRLENQRLKRLLDFKHEQEAVSLPARVIAEDASSWFRTVMINKGSIHGVIEGLPVVVSEGVVGRVVRVAPKSSRVLLITDASSAVASLIQDNRARGVCRGQGEELTFDFVLRQEEVHVGDRVVTSGMGGIFPKGLVVGTVESFVRKDFGLFQAVKLTPAVDFSHLEEVLVMMQEEE